MHQPPTAAFGRRSQSPSTNVCLLPLRVPKRLLLIRPALEIQFTPGGSAERTGPPDTAPPSVHPFIIPPISSRDSTPTSATNTIRARGTPSATTPPDASVARPPASRNTI